jgi:hypothetical protein
VLAVTYSEDLEEIMVWYYDVDRASQECVTEDMMEEATNFDPREDDYDWLEYIGLEEVVEWIALSNANGETSVNDL